MIFISSQVSCLAVHENLSQTAVGFVDGTVIVIKGDITNARFVYISSLPLPTRR